MKVIETTGIINNSNFLKINKQIDKKLLNKSVRILIIFPDDIDNTDEIDENLWMKSISNNEAFDFLNNAEEDIYSLSDGKPFEYEI